mgnify:CR=1 FL=1
MSTDLRLQALHDAALRVGRHAADYRHRTEPGTRSIVLNTYRPAHATAQSPIVLVQHGVTDVDRYSVTPGNRDFIPDFFVD